jgi:hypothetical protein
MFTRIRPAYLAALCGAVVLFLSVNAHATGKPDPVPSQTQTANASSNSVVSNANHNASGSWSEASANGGQGGSGYATSGGNTFAPVTNVEDRLQAPATSAASVFPSGVCGSGGSLALSVPGGSIGGSRASKEIIGCERREWFRLLIGVHPQLALKIACSDPVVKAALGDDACVLPVAPVATVAPPVDLSGYATKADVSEAVTKAFKSTVAK